MSLIPPPGIDLYANQSPRVISSGIALIILPTLFVIVRFASRAIARAGFWWDDLLVVVSLLLSYGPNTAMMICTYLFLQKPGLYPAAIQWFKDAELAHSGAIQWVWETSLGTARSQTQYEPISENTIHLHHILLLFGRNYQIVHVSSPKILHMTEHPVLTGAQLTV